MDDRHPKMVTHHVAEVYECLSRPYRRDDANVELIKTFFASLYLWSNRSTG